MIWKIRLKENGKENVKIFALALSLQNGEENTREKEVKVRGKIYWAQYLLHRDSYSPQLLSTSGYGFTTTPMTVSTTTTITTTNTSLLERLLRLQMHLIHVTQWMRAPLFLLFYNHTLPFSPVWGPANWCPWDWVLGNIYIYIYIYINLTMKLMFKLVFFSIT